MTIINLKKEQDLCLFKKCEKVMAEIIIYGRGITNKVFILGQGITSLVDTLEPATATSIPTVSGQCGIWQEKQQLQHRLPEGPPFRHPLCQCLGSGVQLFLLRYITNLWPYPIIPGNCAYKHSYLLWLSSYIEGNVAASLWHCGLLSL